MRCLANIPHEDGFRTYRAGCGPLDYYVILGDGTLPSIVSLYASLVSPSVLGHLSQVRYCELCSY
jgi:hypothetical protein